MADDRNAPAPSTSDPAAAGPGNVDKHLVVTAFAAHAGLVLTEDERERLEEYVDTVWDMAARLREVDTPGLEGLRDEMPLRAAHANRGEAARRRRPGAGRIGEPSTCPTSSWTPGSWRSPVRSLAARSRPSTSPTPSSSASSASTVPCAPTSPSTRTARGRRPRR